MIIIADSGATKTDWLITFTNDRNYKIIKTEGINPFHQTEEKIRDIVFKQFMPEILASANNNCECSCKGTSGNPSEKEGVKIYFYGAGCLPEPSKVIKKILSEAFPDSEITVETDLTGAARALCQHSRGIACILGTGSNSCMYDGEKVADNISPLGYILGDEGSGAYIGKRFIGDCLKKQLPESLKDGFLNEYNLSVSDILRKVYREPQANRFLASVTPYIYNNKSNPHVRKLLKDCFSEFFRRNVLNYNITDDLKINFTGSVAWYFHDEIIETAKDMRLNLGIFMKEPILGLLDFHLSSEN